MAILIGDHNAAATADLDLPPSVTDDHSDAAVGFFALIILDLSDLRISGFFLKHDKENDKYVYYKYLF